jgi:DNA-binding LacI/PurR family transcriptional regulator
MREHRVDGVILCSPNFAPEQSKQLNSYNIPIVALNNQASGNFQFTIYHDDIDGGRQACQHLIELGHIRIGYLGNSSAGRSSQERLEGFNQAMEAAGIPVNPKYIHQIHGNNAEQGLEGVDYFLRLEQTQNASGRPYNSR